MNWLGNWTLNEFVQINWFLETFFGEIKSGDLEKWKHKHAFGFIFKLKYKKMPFNLETNIWQHIFSMIINELKNCCSKCGKYKTFFH